MVRLIEVAFNVCRFSALSEMVRKCTFACPNVLCSQMLFLYISSPLSVPFHLLLPTRTLLLFLFTHALHCLRLCSSIKVYEDFSFRSSKHTSHGIKQETFWPKCPLFSVCSSPLPFSSRYSVQSLYQLALSFCDLTSSSASPTWSLHQGRLTSRLLVNQSPPLPPTCILPTTAPLHHTTTPPILPINICLQSLPTSHITIKPHTRPINTILPPLPTSHITTRPHSPSPRAAPINLNLTLWLPLRPRHTPTLPTPQPFHHPNPLELIMSAPLQTTIIFFHTTTIQLTPNHLTTQPPTSALTNCQTTGTQLTSNYTTAQSQPTTPNYHPTATHLNSNLQLLRTKP